MLSVTSSRIGVNVSHELELSCGYDILVPDLSSTFHRMSHDVTHTNTDTSSIRNKSV
jgi:hypothetical protein